MARPTSTEKKGRANRRRTLFAGTMDRFVTSQRLASDTMLTSQVPIADGGNRIGKACRSEPFQQALQIVEFFVRALLLAGASPDLVKQFLRAPVDIFALQ